MELFYPTDIAIVEFNDLAMSPRLPKDEIAELNRQLNVNLTDTDSGSDGNSEEWFDSEPLPVGVHIVDADEFFDRFCN